MHIHQDRPASSGQWLWRHDLLNFITTLYEGDLHAKRVLSLAKATVGVLTSASLAIHAVGRGLAQAMGTLTKHGVKQVDRLLSNRGVDVWAFFAYWTPFIVGARTEVVVALDWTSFAADGHDTIVLSMVTGHGRATPLLWKTVASSTLKGNQRRYEYEVLCRLREVLPAGVKVTVVADRGFGDCKLFYALTTELAFEYVIRLRGDISVTNARGERRAAAAWVGAGGRARRLVGARVTDTYELPVGVVVCVHDPKMDEPWCLVASEATVPTRVLIRYYGKRWGIEAGFRDIKDIRFGMGLSSMHVSRPDRRDRLLLISALAIAVLSLLGAAGERIGYDRWLKANTVKRRTHSLFRQGLMLYHHLPNWPEDRVRRLMETFGSMLMEQRVYREVFGRDLMPAKIRGCMRVRTRPDTKAAAIRGCRTTHRESRVLAAKSQLLRGTDSRLRLDLFGQQCPGYVFKFIAAVVFSTLALFVVAIAGGMSSLLKFVWVAVAPAECLHSRERASR